MEKACCLRRVVVRSRYRMLRSWGALWNYILKAKYAIQVACEDSVQCCLVYLRNGRFEMLKVPERTRGIVVEMSSRYLLRRRRQFHTKRRRGAALVAFTFVLARFQKIAQISKAKLKHATKRCQQSMLWATHNRLIVARKTICDSQKFGS